MKLDRPEQAIEAFESAGAPPPGRDPLLDHYHALACWEAKLYLRADRLLARVGARAGPRVAEQVARMRADIAALFAAEPPRDTIEWYIARCDDLRRADRPILARATCEEAAALAARRADRHGGAAAAERLAALGVGRTGIP